MEVDNPDAKVAANAAQIADLQRRIGLEDEKFRAWRVRIAEIFILPPRQQAIHTFSD